MEKLKISTKFLYGIGNLGYGTIGQTVNNFIMFFATSVLGISGSLVGIAVALSTFWDGVSDPLLGYISDRHRSKVFGKRLGFMLFATFGIVIFNILLWIVPCDISEGYKFVWILVCLLMLETFNTCFATPYVALGIDIAPDYNEQSSIQGFKTVFFILGMVMPSVLMMIFMPSTSADAQGQFSRLGYINISYVTSIIAIICGALCISGTLKKAKQMETYDKIKKEKNAFWNIFYGFFKTLGKKNFGSIILGYSVSLISAALLTSVGLHLFTYAFHFNSIQISLLMSVLFFSAIISQPLWIYLSKRMDKGKALQSALVLSILGIGFACVVFCIRDIFSEWTLWALISIPIFVCGFGTGALYSLPISMFADVITMEKIRTGQNHTATYSGFMTLAFNISNSLTLLIVGVLLDLIKFNPKEPVQALSVQNALGIIVFGGCAIAISLSIAIFSKYKLKRSDVLKAQMKAQENAQDRAREKASLDNIKQNP